MADAFSDLNPAPPPAQASTPSKTATDPIHPRQWMSPGWYWAFLTPAEAGSVWTAFTKQNPTVRTRKTVGTGGEERVQDLQWMPTPKGSWILFEVTGPGPVIWTLSGFPTKALKGGATEYQDVVSFADTPPDTADSLSKFLEGIGKQLGTAGQVLLWGGVAVLLYQLFQKTGGGSGVGSRGSAREEREEYEEERVTTRRSGPRALVDRRHSEPTRTRQGTLVSHYR